MYQTKIIPRTNLYWETASLPSALLRFGENLQLEAGLESDWGECDASKILWHKTPFARNTEHSFLKIFMSSSIYMFNIKINNVLMC